MCLAEGASVHALHECNVLSETSSHPSENKCFSFVRKRVQVEVGPRITRKICPSPKRLWLGHSKHLDLGEFPDNFSKGGEIYEGGLPFVVVIGIIEG